MKTLEQRTSALEVVLQGKAGPAGRLLSGEVVETVLAKLRAEWSLPLDEQLENLRNSPITHIYEEDDFWETMRPFQIRDLEIDIAARDGLAGKEAKRLREESGNACRSGHAAPPPWGEPSR